MPHRILNENWSEYDNMKKRWTDRFYFSCDEPWEVSFLVRLIKKHYPSLSEKHIRMAIESCCSELHGNKPREIFVRCVIGKL
jgi:hypothetical protein